MKLNRKGFTLIEVLAVIVILSMLMVIMVPVVGTLLEKNREDNYKNLENSILQVAKIYMSDHRYDVSVIGFCPSDNGASLSIGSIGDNEIIDNKLPVRILVNEGDITTNKNGDIINPRNDSQILNLEDSYVIVKYSCDKKDYLYDLDSGKGLIWK